MAVIADTLRAKKRLVEAGFSDEKAEGIVAIFNEADAQVATKLDLELFRKDNKAEITDVRKEVEHVRKEIELLKRDLTIRLGGIMVAGIGITLAVLSLILTRLPG